MMEVEIEGVTSLEAEFQFRGKWSRQRSYSLARQFGERMLREVQARAQGSPGPEEHTGAYLASMGYIVNDLVAVGGLGAAVEVFSVAPQAMRLEYGFVGTDSTGRVYHQPPLPHWGPAVDVVEPEFFAAMELITDFDVAAV